MMAKKLALKSFRLKNFKAIKDSGLVKFTPLTVLIGDNGSGKSSLIEGLRTYQTIVRDGLDAAMNEWRGLEFIRFAGAARKTQNGSTSRQRQPGAISFSLSHCVGHDDARQKTQSHSHSMHVAGDSASDRILIADERWNVAGRKYLCRDRAGAIVDAQGERLAGGFTLPASLPFKLEAELLPPGRSLLSSSRSHPGLSQAVESWQFLALDAWNMGEPRPIQRAGGWTRLRSDGANIAEYLNEIRERDPDTFEGIIDAMQFVMPYMREIKPVLTDFLGRQMHLAMQEADFVVPGWLLSTGTLRILALLALFRHPNPPPVIVIEELENGLDPRCIHLIVEEIRNVVESGRSQVIITTHSPYLLDLLPLWSIVLVEREDGPPTFTRPGDDESLQRWSRRFGPGKLYTMEALSAREE